MRFQCVLGNSSTAYGHVHLNSNVHSLEAAMLVATVAC